MPDKIKNFWNVALLISAEMLLSLVLLAIAISALVFLMRKQLRKYKYIDLAIFKNLQAYTTPERNRLMLFFTLLGKHQFLIPANLVLIFYFLFISRQSWFSIRVAAIALSSLALMFLLKYIFKRKRPLAPLLQAVKGLSFPSGHAIMAVTFYGLIIYILFHTVKHEELNYFFTAVLVVLILLIGFSRIYLRVHYASDVVAGFIIGILWLSISLTVLAKMENFFSRTEIEESFSSFIVKNIRSIVRIFLFATFFIFLRQIIPVNLVFLSIQRFPYFRFAMS